MFRLPFLFIITGMIGFVVFHGASLFSLSSWFDGSLRGPNGWFHIHLFVLGWATMLAMGAVYQLISVILQSQIYSQRLGFFHYGLFTVGLTGLLYGFIQTEVIWIAVFAAVTFIGILLFTWNMTVTLWRAAQWDVITISVACAVIYLLFTGIFGMLMGLNFFSGAWPLLHDRLFGAHIWLGTIGWFGLLISGVSYKMLPMFYLSHQYPTKLQNATLILWNGSVLVGAIAFLIDAGFWLQWIALLLLTSALMVYNLQIIQIQKHRHKANPGQGITWFVYGTQAFSVISIIIVIYMLWFPQLLLHPRALLLGGWIYLGGWLSFTILSYASKIIPFLWWTFKYGKHVGKPGTPTMAQLLDDRKVNIGLAAIACTLLILFISIILDWHMITAVSSMIYSIFSIMYIGLMGLVFAK